MSALETFLEPADWPLADQILPLLGTALARLELRDKLARVTIVLDEWMPDERVWMQLGRLITGRSLMIWVHPDQMLHERPRLPFGALGSADWEQGPIPLPMPKPSTADFSLFNTQRILYQQLLLVRDIFDGLLRPESLKREKCEAFQEAWLVTIDGRLQRAGLPHLSAAGRRLRFLRVFASGAVLTPVHWTIFNQLWEGELLDQAAVLAKIRFLPELRRYLRP